MTDAWHTHFVKYRRSCYSLRRYASHGTTRQKIVGPCGGVAHILVATRGCPQAGRSAMFGGKVFAVVTKRDPGLATAQICQRNIRSVRAIRFRIANSAAVSIPSRIVSRDTFPSRCELRPSRHTMDVGRHRNARERTKLAPAPLVHAAGLGIHGKLPVLEPNLWRWTR
jgi:hypothetical protein